MSSYAPLKIEPDAEVFAAKSNGRGSRQLLKWLHGFLPLRIYYERPYGRASLEAGLRSRTKFPATDWEEVGIKADDALRVLGILQAEMNLPNVFLVPDDPLSLVMIPDYDDFPQESVRLGIREQLGIDIGRETLRKAYEENWQISELVKLVLSVSSPGSDC